MDNGNEKTISNFIKRQLFTLSPVSITLIYLIAGILWIAFSDNFLDGFTDDIDVLSAYQTYKGWGYIIVTGFFLFLLISTMQRERSKNVKKLKESELLFKNLFAKNPAPVFLYEIDTKKIIEANEAAELTYGYSYSEFMNMQLGDISSGSNPKALKSQLLEKSKPSKSNPKWEHITKEGKKLIVEVYNYRFSYQKQTVELALIQNVTDEFHARNELNKAYQRLRNHLNYTPLGVIEWDNNMRLTYMNSVAEDLFGYKYDEVAGKNPSDWNFVHEDDRQDVNQLIEQFAMANHQNFISTNRNYHKNGEIIHCLWYNTVITDKNGNFECLLSLVADITKQVKYEKEIKELNQNLEKKVKKRTQELEAVNSELEAFSYSVSHDLRAPLRAVNGFTEAFIEENKDNISEDGLHYLQRVTNAADKMNTLIDSYLKISRITRADLNMEEVNLTELARESLDDIQKMYPDKKMAFSIEDDIYMMCDKNMFRIVFDNLFSNAFKFSAKKEDASISVKRKSANMLEIEDNGVGFNMDNYEKLFQPFRRLHDAQEYEGIGIGLASVQRIINRHGGKISAESIVGNGATFMITLPDLF